MKKLLTIGLILLSMGVFAQRNIDYEAQVTDPQNGTTVYNQVPFNFTVTLKNNGTDTILKGDTLFYQFTINGSAASQISGFLLDEDILPGGSKVYPFNGLKLTISQDADNVSMCLVFLLQNRANPITDGNTSNNSGCVTLNFRVSQSSGIADVAHLENIQIYPNPASDVLNIRYDLTGSSSIRFNLFDLNGKVVSSNTMNNTFGNHEYSLDLSDIAEGIYIIEMSTENRTIREKIVISK